MLFFTTRFSAFFNCSGRIVDRGGKSRLGNFNDRWHPQASFIAMAFSTRLRGSIGSVFLWGNGAFGSEPAISSTSLTSLPWRDPLWLERLYHRSSTDISDSLTLGILLMFCRETEEIIPAKLVTDILTGHCGSSSHSGWLYTLELSDDVEYIRWLYCSETLSESGLYSPNKIPPVHDDGVIGECWNFVALFHSSTAVLQWSISLTS